MNPVTGGPNIQMLYEVAKHLEWLLDRVVFVGGAITELLLTDKAKIGIRPTKDVDIIVEVTSRLAYAELEQSLRKHGYNLRAEDGDPVCRWLIGSIAVDFMPVKPDVLGFSNRWYPEAVENYFIVPLTHNLKIKVIAPIYFLATKLEAFLGRGQGDYLISHDIEDIITVINGRAELVEEIRGDKQNIRAYLSEQFRIFRQIENFSDAILWNLPADTASQRRYPIIVQRIQEIIGLA